MSLNTSPLTEFAGNPEAIKNITLSMVRNGTCRENPDGTWLLARSAMV
jgi:hypothetical protein